MKKYTLIFIILTLLFASCGFNVSTTKSTDNTEVSSSASNDDNIKNRKISHKYMKSALDDYAAEVMRCLTDCDADGLKSIFTDSSIEKLELDKDIQNCFSFLGDEVLSYGNVETHTLGSTSGIGHISRLTGEATVYEVKTKNDVYKIYIGIVLICDDDPSEVGIQKIKVYNSKYDFDDPNKEDNMVSIGEFLGSWYS